MASFNGNIFNSAGWNNFGEYFDNFQEFRLRKKRDDECTSDQLDASQGCARILENGYATNVINFFFNFITMILLFLNINMFLFSKGDSGCPLVFNHELVGIISTAFVERNDLVIYIDLWTYIRWIRSIILAY